MKTQPQVVLLLLGAIQARESAGKCPEVKPFQDIDAERMEGEWYPIWADKHKIEKDKWDVSCFKAKVTLARNWWADEQEKYWHAMEEAENELCSSSSDSDSDSDSCSSCDEEYPIEDNELEVSAKDPKKEKKKEDKKEKLPEENNGVSAEKPKKEAKKEDKKEKKKEDKKEKKKEDKKEKKEKKNKKEPKVGEENANQDQNSVRLINQAKQINKGGVTGLSWTVDLQTKGDAIGKGYFMGIEMGQCSVVDTDYDTYIIGWQCKQIDENTKEEYWGVNVRDPNLSEAELQKIWDKANEHLKKANELADADLKPEDQYNLENDWMKIKQGDDVCEYAEWW